MTPVKKSGRGSKQTLVGFFNCLCFLLLYYLSVSGVLGCLRYLFPRTSGFAHRFTHINGLRMFKVYSCRVRVLNNFLDLGFMFLGLGF